MDSLLPSEEVPGERKSVRSSEQWAPAPTGVHSTAPSGGEWGVWRITRPRVQGVWGLLGRPVPGLRRVGSGAGLRRLRLEAREGSAGAEGRGSLLGTGRVEREGPLPSPTFPHGAAVKQGTRGVP